MLNLQNFDPSQWVLITHRDCMDGSTAGLIWSCAGADLVVYVHPFEVDDTYRGWKRDDPSRRVLFVDVAPTVHQLRPQDVVIDHHASNVVRFESASNACVDVSRCGCRAMLDAFLSEGVLDDEHRTVVAMLRNLVEVVDDYDRHQGQRPVAESLALLHEALGVDRFHSSFENKIAKGCADGTHKWLGNINDFALLTIAERELVDVFHDLAERYVDDVCTRSWRVDGDVRGYACVFADQHINQVCERLLRDNPDCAFAVLVDTKRGSLSFRSRNPEDDCVDLVKSFGIIGGGHVCAAGARIPEWMWHELRAQIGV